MSLNKKILAAAIVSGLFATTANAAVDISLTPAAAPVQIASELIVAGTGTTIPNAGNRLDLLTSLRYSMSDGETRHVRIECSPNVRFTAGSAPSYVDGGAPGATGTVALGAINGIGTNAISFSVTATAAGVGDTASDKFVVNGSRTLTSKDAASCTYGLYDQPSQAANGGEAGRIATSSGAYLTSQSGYVFSSTGNTTASNVESVPVFTRFVTTGTNAGVSATVARLAELRFYNRPGDQLNATGTDVLLTELFATGASGTNITVAGDFAAAANANGTFTGGGPTSRVFLADAANCTGGVVNADSVTASSARFNVGATPQGAAAPADGRFLCLTTEGTAAIPASTYTATLNAVSATPATYAPASTGPLAAGEIVRNGTELQAPLVQAPAGYISRMILTNKGPMARPYTVEVLMEDGNSRSGGDPSLLTGSVPANSMVVVELNNLLGMFSAAPRGALNVTVAGPNTQIQGLYQIVRPDTGSISNHVMVRPGTN